MGVKAAEVTLCGEDPLTGSVSVNTELVPALQFARLAYALKTTLPPTVPPEVTVTVAVSAVEPPRVMGVGETNVVMDEDITSRVSPESPHLVVAKSPFLIPAGV